MAPLTLAILLRVPAVGVRDFQAYEDRVLPLLPRHGGALERRLRNADGTAEIHIVRFASRIGFEGFRNDPDRVAAATLFAASGATADITEMTDV